MLRLIILILLVLLILVGGLAVALYHFLGWKGMLVFPVVLIGLFWLGKFLIKQVVKRFALGLLGMKSGALRAATMQLHSIKSVPKPAKTETLKPPAVTNGEDDETDDSETSEADTPDTEEEEKPKDYVEMDVTIVPDSKAEHPAWEPGELILTSGKVASFADLESKLVGNVHCVEVWNGTEFRSDDPGKYEGKQRLKVVFGVNPGTNTAWLHYYNEPIGPLKLPPGTIDV